MKWVLRACLLSPSPTPGPGPQCPWEDAHTLISRSVACVFPESNFPLRSSSGFLGWLVIHKVGLDCHPRAWERTERESGERVRQPRPQLHPLMALECMTVRQRPKLTSINKLPGPTLVLVIKDSEAQGTSTYHTDCTVEQRGSDG